MGPVFSYNGALAALRSRPILLLLLLTPGIPEYLSGSSPINAIILNPGQFVFQLLANLGLYGSGALLIHDARVRWNKGWITVVLLGLAYGILEEGVALSTLFDPKAGPVGSYGVYGHWLGVNWVWLAGVVPFHAIFSITIPIVLLGLALPKTQRTRLLSEKGTAAALVILASTVVFLMVLVFRSSGYWMGLPVLLASLVSIGALVWAAHRIPAWPLSSSAMPQNTSFRNLALVGASFFVVSEVVPSLGESIGFPAAADFAVAILVQALYIEYMTKQNWVDNPRGILAFAIGLLIPIAALGFLSEVLVPFTLLADIAMVLFFRRLWANYSPEPAKKGRLG